MSNEQTNLKTEEQETTLTIVLFLTGDLAEVAEAAEKYIRKFSPTLYDTHVVGRFNRKDGSVEWIVSRSKTPRESVRQFPIGTTLIRNLELLSCQKPS